MTDRHIHRRLDDATGHLLVLGVLLVLQYGSLGLHYIGFDGYPVVALVIAGVMVVISASVYMDLRWSLAPTRLVAVLAVLYLALLCLGVAGDVAFR
ncbi:MAG TPA: hypothetical protein VHW23_31210 [Kofleriaceae bacterium]|jgi:cytochrome c oxidase subunit IV|nr:hypothetical protein [Kofleriaceae bacterium]